MCDISNGDLKILLYFWMGLNKMKFFVKNHQLLLMKGGGELLEHIKEMQTQLLSLSGSFIASRKPWPEHVA